MMDDALDPLLPYREAADMLGTTVRSLRQKVFEKRIQVETLPGYTQRKGIRRSEVQRYAERRAQRQRKRSSPVIVPDDADALLTYDEAAKLLGLTPHSLRQMVYWKRIHPESLPGATYCKRIRRSEVQRYADQRAQWPRPSSSRVILPDEAEMRTHAQLLASLMAFGLSTDGSRGASLRREMREQVSILARSARGRELLARAWEVLVDMESDGIPGILSAAEQIRLDFFQGLIRGALAPYQDASAIAEDAESGSDAGVTPHTSAVDQPHAPVRPAARERTRQIAARNSTTVTG